VVAPGINQIDLGAVSITMLSDGEASRILDEKFVRNAPLADVQAELRDMGRPSDKLINSYNVIFARIGAERVLFDTGNGEFGGTGTGKLLENMRKAGIDPQSVTAVVISHFHGDHINGLRNKAGAIAFPNARIFVPQPEWTWWMDDGRLAATAENARGGLNTARRVFTPIADSVIRFEPGTEILPGVRSIPAYGHTPGHTAFMIEGGSRKLLYWADTTNVDLFVRQPEWAVMFDMDAQVAAATRRKIADLALAEHALVAGYHLSGMGVGNLAARGKGYEYSPLK
jgi:glyoxylase-like metal-dependent hydrolase (beta-lactamase superfamily II)